MRVLQALFDNNRRWAERVRRGDGQFFAKLTRQQAPEYLWIGCSDSRVPANQIVDLLPGELFVHRNVANLVPLADLNCLSVMQFAVDVLRVRHIIVCGHYGCGGVRAALEDHRHGLVDNWLKPIQRLARAHGAALEALGDDGRRIDRLCELNVIEQVANVCATTVVQDAWARGQELVVHGWIYSIADGLLHDLGVCVGAADDREGLFARAIAEITSEAVGGGGGQGGEP